MLCFEPCGATKLSLRRFIGVYNTGSECHTQTKQLDDKEKRRGKGIVDGLRRIEQEQATFAEASAAIAAPLG